MSESQKNEERYWNLELNIKHWESIFYSVVGGDGAIYAIRRELYSVLDQDDINDFINPLQIISRDYIGIFNPKAICNEDAAGNFHKEFKRKRRIVNRSWRAFLKSINKFSIRRHARFLFELFSHKVIRWLGFLFFVIMAACCAIISLLVHEIIYLLFFAGILIYIFIVFFAMVLDKNNIELPRLISLFYYFYFVNLAAMLGIIDNIFGIKHITWDHVRKPGNK